MRAKITTEEFISRAISVHGDRYCYDSVVYKRMLEKVTITCLLHGDFLQTPADHLWNHGCPNCKSDKASIPWKEIYDSFPDYNKEYYTYDETTYTRNSVKMKIVCPVHGEFWQKPELHKAGSGCKKCNASGGPGKYCETIFNRKPELKTKQGIIYFLELYDTDGTKYFKVGITVSLKNRFYNFIEKNNGRLLWKKEGLLYDCFLLEQKILAENKEFLYTPSNLLCGGKHECLTKEIDYAV